MATTALIAQTQPPPPLTPEQKKQIAEVRALWLVMAGICVALVVSLAIFATVRWARRTKGLFAKPAKPKPIKDAWAEAGRRAEPEPEPLDEEGGENGVDEGEGPPRGGAGGER